MNRPIDRFHSTAKPCTMLASATQLSSRNRLLKWSSLFMSLLLTTSLYANEHAIELDKLAIDRQGIKVWTYKMADNPVFNYRATTTLKSSLSIVTALIINPETATKWAPYVSQIDVISPQDSTGMIVFRMELDMPFPLQDRDAVIRAQLHQAEDGSVTITSEAVKDARMPERSGVVRVTHYQGSWNVRALGRGQVEVTTSGYADLGGYVPLSFANMFVQQQPYQMLRNMRSYIQQSVSQPMALANMQKP